MKAAILAAGDEPRGKRERLEPDAMARPFVVEGESIAGMANLHQPALEVDPAGAACRLRRPAPRCQRRIGRMKRIEGQQMLGVHQQQLLMLLFVMQAELDER